MSEEWFVARIHSHPGEAFHSDTDDRNPVTTFDGALSIVVPYFGLDQRHGLEACAVYRRTHGEWRELPPGPQRDRWLVVDAAPRSWPPTLRSSRWEATVAGDDPRLRILGSEASDLAEPVLAALDTTTVLIRLAAT